MKTIVINNKIQLIEDFTQIEVKVICPRRNIQKMLEATKARFVSKKEINLNYNHNAGRVFEVVITARFENVEMFLKSQSVYNYTNASNFEAYVDLIDINKFSKGFFAMQTKNCYENIITSLYQFGDCSELQTISNSYTRYFRKDGHSTLRIDSEYSEFGKKRYIKTKKGWTSNKKY